MPRRAPSLHWEHPTFWLSWREIKKVTHIQSRTHIRRHTLKLLYSLGAQEIITSVNLPLLNCDSKIETQAIDLRDFLSVCFETEKLFSSTHSKQRCLWTKTVQKFNYKEKCEREQFVYCLGTNFLGLVFHIKFGLLATFPCHSHAHMQQVSTQISS